MSTFADDAADLLIKCGQSSDLLEAASSESDDLDAAGEQRRARWRRLFAVLGTVAAGAGIGYGVHKFQGSAAEQKLQKALNPNVERDQTAIPTEDMGEAFAAAAPTSGDAQAGVAGGLGAIAAPYLARAAKAVGNKVAPKQTAKVTRGADKILNSEFIRPVADSLLPDRGRGRLLDVLERVSATKAKQPASGEGKAKRTASGKGGGGGRPDGGISRFFASLGGLPKSPGVEGLADMVDDPSKLNAYIAKNRRLHGSAQKTVRDAVGALNSTWQNPGKLDIEARELSKTFGGGEGEDIAHRDNLAAVSKHLTDIQTGEGRSRFVIPSLRRGVVGGLGGAFASWALRPNSSTPAIAAPAGQRTLTP